MNNLPPRQPGSKESGILQRLRQSLRHIPIDRPHVLLACSGGKDSVALASMLAELARLNTLSMTIAHIHHGQHDLADVAASAVTSIGRMLDVPVIVRHLEAQAVATHEHFGLEEALRRERYLALARIAKEVNASCIALAHHQSDQAETLLLHLIRGSGVDGLAGMREWEIRHVPWWEEPAELSTGIWRPLIYESAATVADLAAQSGLPIVEDPTNTNPSFRRNAIRHNVLPILEGISPGSTAAIARSARVIATDADLLSEATMVHLAACRTETGLSRMKLVDLPDGWQHRVVRSWLIHAALPTDITYDRVSAVVELSQRNRGGSRVELGAGTRVVLRNGVLGIEGVAE